jgi:hypothetical protein
MNVYKVLSYYYLRPYRKTILQIYVRLFLQINLLSWHSVELSDMECTFLSKLLYAKLKLIPIYFLQKATKKNKQMTSVRT